MSYFLQVLIEKVRASAKSPPMHPFTIKPMAMHHDDGASSNNYQVAPHSPPMHPSINKPMAVHRNDGASSNNYQVRPQATSSGAAGRNHEYVCQEIAHLSDSSMPSDDDDFPQPLMTVEDMARLFKQKYQPAHYKPPVDIKQQQLAEENRERQTEEELLKSEQEVDKVLQELDRSRKERNSPSGSAPGSPKPPFIKSQALLDDELEELGENDDDRPYDPNLVCPKCGKQYRVGELQKLKRHILKCSN